MNGPKEEAQHTEQVQDASESPGDDPPSEKFSQLSTKDEESEEEEEEEEKDPVDVFREEALEKHNQYRKRHGVNPLQLNRCCTVLPYVNAYFKNVLGFVKRVVSVPVL